MSNFTICYWFHFHYHHTVMSLMSYCSDVNSECSLLDPVKEQPKDPTISSMANKQRITKSRNKIKAKCSNIRKKEFNLAFYLNSMSQATNRVMGEWELVSWLYMYIYSYFSEYHVEKNQWNTIRVEFSISRVKTKSLRASVWFTYAINFTHNSFWIWMDYFLKVKCKNWILDNNITYLEGDS